MLKRTAVLMRIVAAIAAGCIIIGITGCGKEEKRVELPDNNTYDESLDESLALVESDNTFSSSVSNNKNEEEISLENEEIDAEDNVPDGTASAAGDNTDDITETGGEFSDGSTLSEASPEVIRLTEKYIDSDGILDLEMMLSEGMGLLPAQSGLFDDNYSVSFVINNFTHKENPGCIFVYSFDGVYHYMRECDSSGEIKAVFRNFDLTMSYSDAQALYDVFKSQNIEGFQEI